MSLIFLDLDGVLAECHVTAARYFGVDVTLETWPHGKRTMELVHEHDPNITQNDDAFWAIFPEEFWATLPKTPECDEIVAACANNVGQENVKIASRPTSNPRSWSGKRIWVQHNLPTWIHHQLILTEEKWLLAKPGRMLIDDSFDVCTKFADRGGQTRWVPRPWGGCKSSSLLAITNDIARMCLTEEKLQSRLEV